MTSTGSKFLKAANERGFIHQCTDEQALDELTDVVIHGGRIKCIGESGGKVDRVIHAEGLIVAPGFIDMHAHLREPGMTSADPGILPP